MVLAIFIANGFHHNSNEFYVQKQFAFLNYVSQIEYVI